jgi:hypothetical protein
MSKPSAKPAGAKIPNGKPAAAKKGSSAPSAVDLTVDKLATHRHTENELRTQTNRGITAGGGVKRGDRRDTHPSFSTGKVSRDGGRSGPLGRATRKSGPKSSGNKPAGT